MDSATYREALHPEALASWPSQEDRIEFALVSVPVVSTHLEVPRALRALIQRADQATPGHAERVSDLAAQIARCGGLPSEMVALTRTVGLLHDVGKIGIPQSILTKPCTLDPREEAVVRTHPDLSELIVRRYPGLADTLPGIRHHHERWDGEGYPMRLAAESIPLAARIVAIADTFDAITHNRVYRSALPPDVALHEILRESGRQFDPAWVAIFRQSDFASRVAA